MPTFKTWFREGTPPCRGKRRPPSTAVQSCERLSEPTEWSARGHSGFFRPPAAPAFATRRAMATHRHLLRHQNLGQSLRPELACRTRRSYHRLREGRRKMDTSTVIDTRLRRSFHTSQQWQSRCCSQASNYASHEPFTPMTLNCIQMYTILRLVTGLTGAVVVPTPTAHIMPTVVTEGSPFRFIATTFAFNHSHSPLFTRVAHSSTPEGAGGICRNERYPIGVKSESLPCGRDSAHSAMKERRPVGASDDPRPPAVKACERLSEPPEWRRARASGVFRPPRCPAVRCAGWR